MKKLTIIAAICFFLMACGNGTTNTNSNTNSANGNPTNSVSNSANSTNNSNNQANGKKYAEMSDAEKRQYLAQKAQNVSRLMGNQSNDEIPAAAIDKIKNYVDAYAVRANANKREECSFGDNLQAIYERAEKNATFIIDAFKQEELNPQIGIYLAMIESEHCACLQSPTGALGLFQLTTATAEKYGISAVKGASTTNPDDRCQPEPASKAAAKYVKSLIASYGTQPNSVALAIISFNSGEALNADLKKTTESNADFQKNLWSLMTETGKFSSQLQAENLKYLPKFFAAAIIGENPSDFGLNLSPLSTRVALL